MTVTDHSKGTKFITWCDKCRVEAKIVVHTQRIKQPTTCPFCKGDALVESVRTFPRSGG